MKRAGRAAAAFVAAWLAAALPAPGASAAPRLLDPPVMRTMGDALAVRAKIIGLGREPVTVVLTSDRETTCAGPRGRHRQAVRLVRRMENLNPEGGRVAISFMFPPVDDPCGRGERRSTRFTMLRVNAYQNGRDVLQRTFAPMGVPPSVPGFSGPRTNAGS